MLAVLLSQVCPVIGLAVFSLPRNIVSLTWLLWHHQARALGPWSSARQLVEGRAAALSAREDKIAAAAQAAAEAEAAADWAPKRDHKLGPRLSPRVGRLFDMCLDLLVEYIEDVETLYGLPSAIKVMSMLVALCNTPHTAVYVVDSTYWS